MKFVKLIVLSMWLWLVMVLPTLADGPFAYLPNQTSGIVSVIDVPTNTVVSTINVGTSPNGVAINSDGTRVYITNDGDDTVSVIDTSINILTNSSVQTPLYQARPILARSTDTPMLSEIRFDTMIRRVIATPAKRLFPISSSLTQKLLGQM